MTVTVFPHQVTIDVPAGTNLHQALLQVGLAPDAPCGGRGTCGKCTVLLDGAPVRSCQTTITAPCTVTLPQSGGVQILTGGQTQDVAVDLPFAFDTITLPAGALGDATSDWTRLTRAIEATAGVTIQPNLRLAAQLSALPRTLEAVRYGTELLALRAPGTRWCVAAVDIGTTTVVLHLLDAQTGAPLATESMLNPQTRFGGDVISRMQAALSGQLEALSRTIRAALAELLTQACAAAGVPAADVLSLTAVGNTAMHHLLLGLSPASLAVAPYHPALSQALCLPAAAIDLPICPDGKLFVLPCIAGFVGADTAAVALSEELDTLEDWTLLLDLGTNGELILGNRHRSVACSTAAGPAFEGANIRCGMRCVPGAIDHAAWDGTTLHIHTMDDLPPIGICGSGLLDLVAALRQAEVIDEMGRLCTADEVDDPALAARLCRVEDEACFRLSETDERVRLTQKDIREVQLAKAAIAAGIELLATHLGGSVEDIHEVRIAGAFGSFLRPDSALEIGLLPRALAGRITAVGNAAGEGARRAALSAAEFARAAEITAQVEFLELASSPDFQDCFVDHLTFEEEAL